MNVSSEPNVTISDIGTLLTWYNEKDQLHREDGPAWIQNNHDGHIFEVWYKNDIYHRIGAPASIIRRNDLVIGETWYENGELHRIGGPAVLRLDENGIVQEELWIENGKFHRIGGPASYKRNERTEDDVIMFEKWYEDGELHRIGGPAVIQKDYEGDVIGEDYFLYGDWIEKSDYIRRLSIVKRFANTLKNKYRTRLVSTLKKTDLCDESELYNIIAEYAI
jgi:hypothetical protein